MRIRHSIYFVLSLLCFCRVNAKDIQHEQRKGQLFFYYGWNISWYSKSNITFNGQDYHFTLQNVKAKDRESKFNIDTYFKYNKFTTPQYNFRVGYFFKDNYNISIGNDHMKYVMTQNQVVKIDGEISNELSSYYGIYEGDDIALTEDFLIFEHTDGLNYINAEVRRFDKLVKYRNISINLTEGFGAGLLYPRTNVTIMQNPRVDQFHLSGYGISSVVGVNFTLFDCFFIQTEFKGGYINMPDIITTGSGSDHASQYFFFGQYNFTFGGIIRLGKKQKSVQE